MSTSSPVASRSVVPERLKREVVKLETCRVQRARNAVMWLRSHGEPQLTLTELLDRAIAAYLDDLVSERNGGEEFPDAGHLPQASQMKRA